MSSAKSSTRQRSTLSMKAKTAEALMTPDPMCIGDSAALHHVVGMMVDHGIGAMPVVDGTGKPVGVVSRSDIVRYERERPRNGTHVPDAYERVELKERAGDGDFEHGFQLEAAEESVEVSEVMTPVVYSVTPDTPVRRVIEEMLELRVHRLFVVNDGGALVGVISARDIFRNLI